LSTTTAGRAPTIAPTQPSTRRITDIRAARYMTTRADNRFLVIDPEPVCAGMTDQRRGERVRISASLA